MPSTENTKLQWIQEDIQNVIERERELKQYYDNNICNNKTNGVTFSNSVQNGNDNKIEKQIENSIKENDDRPPLIRARSTPAFGHIVTAAVSAQQSNGHSKPSFRRFVSMHPNTKGAMQRFLKSRGKLQMAGAAGLQGTATSNGFDNTTHHKNGAFNGNLESYDIIAPKIEPGQRIRKGFMSAEEKIQRDIEETYKREAELKTLRQSQGNLTSLDDDELDAPLNNYMGGLRTSKSLAQLYNSNEYLDEVKTAASAPCSLKPARSLAELCDAKESEVTSPQSLIMRFEQMISKHQDSKRT